MLNRTPNYSVDRTLTKLSPNNSWILRFFCEFYELFANFFHNIFCCCFFCSLAGLRSLIRIIFNYSWIIPELFPNHKFLISPNRTWIIHLSLCAHIMQFFFSVVQLLIQQHENDIWDPIKKCPFWLSGNLQWNSFSNILYIQSENIYCSFNF